MKKLAIAFIILSMVFTFWLILPLIFGVIALKKLKTAKTAHDLTGWGIVTLFFVSRVAGIMMLVMTDEDLQEDLGHQEESLENYQCDSETNETFVAPQDVEMPISVGNEFETVQKKLSNLVKLKSQGIIQESEYEMERKRILDEYYK